MIRKLRNVVRRLLQGVDIIEDLNAQGRKAQVQLETRIASISERLDDVLYKSSHLFQQTDTLVGTPLRVNMLADKVEALAAGLDCFRAELKGKESSWTDDGYQPFGDYSYLPQTRHWRGSEAGRRMMQMISAGDDRYESILQNIAKYAPRFEAISLSKSDDPELPYWENGWFPPLDASTLYGMVALYTPNRYIEVGCGNSTKFVRQAIRDHGLRTTITSVDPYPRAEIDAICDRVVRERCEDTDISLFESLTPEDILFIDNSHRSFQNSDVTVFFTEILPSLPPGVLVGVHDIFLPYDYPVEWKARYYNEQYLLAAYIYGGMNGAQIVLPNHHVQNSERLSNAYSTALKEHGWESMWMNGGIFWLRT